MHLCTAGYPTGCTVTFAASCYTPTYHMDPIYRAYPIAPYNFIFLPPPPRWLQRWVGVLDKHLHEVVVPRARLWRGNERVDAPAILIITRSGLIASTVRLSSRLHPNNRVDETITGVSGRPRSKAGILTAVSYASDGGILIGRTSILHQLPPATLIFCCPERP
jgi:hypothetical protein